MRGHMILTTVLLLILCQPLFGHGQIWHFSRVLFPLLGLATCVSSLRVVLRCLWAPGAEEV
jgi:hypothetical protein